MWRILKAEADYHRWMILSMLILIALFTMYRFYYIFKYEGWTSEVNSLNIFYFLLPFFILNSFIPTRFKEKRDRKNIMLPLSSYSIGSSRIMTIILPAILVYLVFFILDTSTIGLENISIKAYFIGYGFIIFIYSMFFIFYDLFLSHLGKNIMIIGIGLLVIGLLINIMIFKFSVPEKTANTVGFIVDSIIHSGKTGVIRLLLLSLVTALASVYSFVHRKSYFDKN
ncbi:hypothetical protein ACFL6G_06370 [candidate division KSB1 bacterium]